jgi:hypothetical protein
LFQLLAWMERNSFGRERAFFRCVLKRIVVSLPGSRANPYEGLYRRKTLASAHVLPGFGLGGTEPCNTLPNGIGRMQQSADMLRSKTCKLLMTSALHVLAYRWKPDFLPLSVARKRRKWPFIAR